MTPGSQASPQTAARSSSKDHTMPQLHYAQLRYLSIIVLAWLAVFVLTRSVLLLSHLAAVDVSLLQWFGVFGVGLVGLRPELFAVCHVASGALPAGVSGPSMVSALASTPAAWPGRRQRVCDAVYGGCRMAVLG
ncbi:hypothetical protein PSEUDO9AZ_20931 [Pseudomonas sp. 9AZ]|nr:hypothetical protein PSEUDO9AZ_20931 [Pseudomonas sp. 9AZ]